MKSQLSIARWCKILPKSISTVVDTDLKMFPEYILAMDFHFKGHLSKATPLLNRVHDVVSSSVGKTSIMSHHIGEKLAMNLLWQGRFHDATKTLSELRTNGSIRGSSIMSLVELMNGNADKALTLSSSAIEVCESKSSLETDITQFSGCYAMHGLINLTLGEASEGEAYLQLAARWAQTPLEQLTALSNLGTANLHMLDQELLQKGSHDSITRHRELRFLSSINNEESSSLLSVELRSHSLLKEAMAYWDEAVRDAQKDALVNPTGGIAATAMCGPTTGDRDSPDMGMTGLGSKVLRVDNASKPPPSLQQITNNTISTLETRLLDVRYAAAYASLLCNMAEVFELQGDLSQRDEYVSSALSALKGHNDDAFAQPVLGRVLSRIAAAHMDASQAVSAEGLLNSAIDKLKSPYALHDLRYRYERAVTESSYGFLLRQWDKRESAGAEKIKAAQLLLDSLPRRFASSSKPVLVSPFVQLPF